MICPDRQADRTCARGYYDGKRLSEGVCQLCTVNGRKPPPARGLGDVIAKLTSSVGIKPCGGCKKRQAALNRAMPFGLAAKSLGTQLQYTYPPGNTRASSTSG